MSTYIGARIGFYKHHLAIPLLNPGLLQVEIPFLPICPMTPVCCLAFSPIVELTRLDTFLVVSSFGSFYYYINVANSNAQWKVFVNGVSQDTFSSNSSGFTNCTYVRSTNLIQLDVSLNITIVVLGSVTENLVDRSSTADPWSLEVNMLL